MMRVWYFMLLILIWGCRQDPIDEIVDPGPGGFQPGEGVFVINEGQFLAGNASVDYYRFADRTMLSNVFQEANSIPIGDILQSALFHDGRIWLVVNNSGFLIGLDPASWEEEVLIEGLRSPRYLLPLGDEKVYLSDLFANEIHILNLENREKTGGIPVGGWIEQMVSLDGLVYVSAPQTDQVYLVDPSDDRLVDSISVGFGPSQLVADGQGFLWVYCQGDESRDIPPGLFRINPITRALEKSLLFPDFELGGWPRLMGNTAGDSLFFLKDGLYALSVEADALPAAPLVPSGRHNWYALGRDDRTGAFFLGDAADFQQAGEVVIFSAEGTPIDSFLTGVIPNSFLFY